MTLSFESGDSKVRNICVIDDNDLLLQSLVADLRRAGYRALGYKTAEAFLETLDWKPAVDCLAADLRLPGIDGRQLLTALRKRGCKFPVVIFSGLVDVPAAIDCIKSGAHNVLQKPFSADMFQGAIRAAVNEYVPVDVNAEEIKRRMTGLTARQIQVLELVVRGHTSKEIGKIMGTSHRTVETQRAAIMARLGVTSLAVMIREALVAYPEWLRKDAVDSVDS